MKNHSADVSHRAVSTVTRVAPITGMAQPGSRLARSASSLVVKAP